MDHIGNIRLLGLGSIKNMRYEQLASDPASPAVGQEWYNTTENAYKGYNGTDIITFASGGSTAVLQSEIDTIEASAGLGTDGSYTAPGGNNYLSGATSLNNADSLLDAQIKTNADAITAIQGVNTSQGTAITNLQTEVDTIETAVGLGTDGSFTAPSGTNYLGAATSVSNMSVLLDTQTKANADAIVTKVSKAGDTMTGNLAFGGTSTVTGLAAPSNATDAARKIDLDNALAGLDFQADVLAVQVDNTLDPGATPATGARYLITDSANLHANFGTITGVADDDIVQFNGTDFVVAYDVSVAGSGALVWDRTDTVWYRYDGTAWSVFGGLGDLNAGVGLVKVGNTINVNLGAGVSQLPTDEVGIDVRASSGLFLTEDGSTDSTGTNAQLAIKLDGSTLALGAGGVKVADAGVGAAQLAAAVAGDGLTGGAGSALAVGAGTGITVAADSVALDTTYTDANYARLDGATFTGAVVLAADATVALGAATKQQVDTVNTRLTDSFYLHDGNVAATSFTVTHNLGQQYPQVQVINSSNKVIQPDEITFDSANQLTVTFLSAITCKITVQAPKA